MSDEFNTLYNSIFGKRKPYENLLICEGLTFKNPFAHLIQKGIKKVVSINYMLTKEFYAVHASRKPHNIGLMEQYLNKTEIQDSRGIQGRIFGIGNFVYINNIKNIKHQKILQDNEYYSMLLFVYIVIYMYRLFIFLV